MKLKKCIILLLLLLVSQFATAQLTGIVVDNEDNYPLEYASVAIYETVTRN